MSPELPAHHLHGQPHRDTVSSRLARYEVQSKRTQYIGAGYAGLAILVSSDLLARAPAVFPPLVLTCLALGSIFNGSAYVNYLFAAARLNALLADQLVEGSDPAGPFPHQFHMYYVGGFIIGALATFLLLAGSWWGVAS